MKKTVRLLALVLVVVMALSLVGCGLNSKLKGEWEYEVIGLKVTMEFDGKDEVTVSAIGGSNSSEYKVDGDKLYIDGDEVKYEFKDNDTLVIDLDMLGELEFKRKK